MQCWLPNLALRDQGAPPGCALRVAALAVSIGARSTFAPLRRLTRRCIQRAATSLPVSADTPRHTGSVCEAAPGRVDRQGGHPASLLPASDPCRRAAPSVPEQGPDFSAVTDLRPNGLQR